MHWIIIVVLAVVSPALSAAVYECADGNGKINFTDRPCEGTKDSQSVGGGAAFQPSQLPFIEPKYQADVANMLGRLAQQNPSCKKRLDLMTVGKSSTQGSAQNPSFFVQCGDTRLPEVVRFTLSDARSGRTPDAKVTISERSAAKECRSAAKARALNPGEVDFSMILDANFISRPNGNSTFSTTFTAVNSFGVENRYFINCMFEGESLTDVSVKPFD